MTRKLWILLLTACATSAISADTSVSITVGQPGFYGQISIGNFPPPLLVYTRPVIIQQAPVIVAPAPIYLHVPPGHEKHWSKHCASYNACGRPVYFVRDDWYNNVYVPRYRQGDGDQDKDHGHHGHGHRHDKDDGDDQGRDHHDH